MYYIHKTIINGEEFEITAYISYPETLQVDEEEWCSAVRHRKQKNTPVAA